MELKKEETVGEGREEEGLMGSVTFLKVWWSYFCLGVKFCDLGVYIGMWFWLLFFFHFVVCTFFVCVCMDVSDQN